MISLLVECLQILLAQDMRQDNSTRSTTTNRWKNSYRVGWATSNQKWWNQNPVSEYIKGWVLADDSKLQVSSLHYKAALLLDEVDRVNLELTNVEYAHRFLDEVDETLSTEQKQGEVAEKKN